MSRFVRAASVAAAALATAVLPALSAAPAQASPEHCVAYLGVQGHNGSWVDQACKLATVDPEAAVQTLEDRYGVALSDALQAVTLAQM